MVYQYGHHGAGGWGLLMILGMAAFWVLLIMVGVAVYRLSSGSAQAHLPTARGHGPDVAPARGPDAEQVLARRFAAGEIDETEYTARLAVLREHHPQ